MKKILFITPFPPPIGGISNWSKLVYNYMNETEVNIVVKYINISPKKRKADGRTFFNRIFYGFFSIIKTKKELKKILKSYRPDVVHISTSGSLALFRDLSLFKMLNSKKIKSVLQLHFGRVPKIIENKKGLEYRLLTKTFKMVNIILSIDNHTSSSLKKIYFDKVVCIPNPFDSSKMPINRILDAKNNNKKISFLGWIVKTKGIEELLVAWNKIYDKYPDWTLDLIGPYEKKYMEYLKHVYSFEGINIIGEKLHNEAMDMINDSDVFVLPSYTEGFPNVILEAMHLGKAIVATNVGAISEMLSDNCGIIIKPKDSIALAESLEKLIKNRELVIEYGRKANIKCEEYSIKNVMELYKKIWFD